ncbi:MazG nucleotide pyrophosphohydrolase domain protein [Poriferisphaera corsica]|uniref:MazG nucleotide pyrophosphohydrolase domain protein n=1 Tax=Poriferisphaera corsica TaxID=2528020 RepID=A0A517YZG8_9BACT|nr:nucleotide pyrophosphohydrolase [Poriferisphaera corsica]QDU35628.1 MazG nucleotide pyrophosphohydrolase domain protein [Poriferisphaera corsica]
MKKCDAETTVGEMKEAVLAFAKARDWEKYHRPKHLAMSIAIEAAEIMEHFQWLSEAQADEAMQRDEVKAEVAEELADVLMYCMELANVAGIDLAEAYFAKLAKNEKRFPADEDWKAKWER